MYNDQIDGLIRAMASLEGNVDDEIVKMVLGKTKEASLEIASTMWKSAAARAYCMCERSRLYERLSPYT